MLLVISHPVAPYPTLSGPWVTAMGSLGEGIDDGACGVLSWKENGRRTSKSWRLGLRNHLGPIFSLACGKERTSVSPHSVRPTTLCVISVRKYHVYIVEMASWHGLY